MKNLCLNFLVALLTFGFAAGFTGIYFAFDSVDERLVAAIRAAEIAGVEKYCRDSRKHALLTAKEPNRFYRVKAISDEQCAEMKKHIDSAYGVKRRARDLENVRLGCEQDNLSASECAARKENAVKDIEENMLGVND